MPIRATDFSAIIFDLGGVLLNLNYQKTIREFEKLGIANAASIYSQATQTPLFDLLETGKISPMQFRAEVKAFFNLSCTNEQLDQAWNAMLMDLPKSRVELLRQVSTQTRMFLFSNTNQIHIDWFKNYLEESNQTNFLSLFEKAYLSHEVQLRKPDVATFKWVIDQNNLNPETTLFIDDSKQHIEGAKQAGLQTYWLQPHEEITELFADFLT